MFALFGYVGTPTSLAALPLVNAAKLPFFGPFTGAEALREPFNRWVFHVRASYFDETALIVRQLVSLGLRRIAVFRQNDSYGQAGLDGVVRALAAHKLAPVAVGLVERNSVDVAKALAAILPSSRTPSSRSAPTRAAPPSSAARAPAAARRSSTTSLSSARRRSPTSWVRRRWVWP